MLSKINSLKLLGIAGTLALASCGGGGDNAAGLTEFSVSPSEYTITGLKGDTLCQDTAGARRVVTIVGGTPPYRVVSANPQRAIVSSTEVTGKNPSFTVTTGTGCGDSLSILVLDYHSSSTTFSLTIEPGEEADTE